MLAQSKRCSTDVAFTVSYWIIWRKPLKLNSNISCLVLFSKVFDIWSCWPNFIMQWHNSEVSVNNFNLFHKKLMFWSTWLTPSSMIVATLNVTYYKKAAFLNAKLKLCWNNDMYTVHTEIYQFWSHKIFPLKWCYGGISVNFIKKCKLWKCTEEFALRLHLSVV